METDYIIIISRTMMIMIMYRERERESEVLADMGLIHPHHNSFPRVFLFKFTNSSALQYCSYAYTSHICTYMGVKCLWEEVIAKERLRRLALLLPLGTFESEFSLNFRLQFIQSAIRI